MKQLTPYVLTVLLCLVCGCSNPTSNPINQRAADARIDLGLAYLNTHDTDKARQNLMRAIALAPNHLRAQLAYTYYLERVGDLSRCDTQYRQLLNAFPNDAHLLNNYGTYLCRQHQYALAHQQFQRALALPNPPNIATLYENTGLCLLQNGQLVQARSSLLKALSYDEHRLTALEQLIQLELKTGDTQQAEMHIRSYKTQTNHAAKGNQFQRQLPPTR